MISVRLKEIANMVDPGKVIADIGTDHGYVPVYLLENNLAETVIASDINEGPLKKAEENIKAHGLSERAELVQSDGMEALRGRDMDTVIISGMGGELITEILGRADLKRVGSLVLSPHTKAEAVRAELIELGFVITDEKMIRDAGKYYVIIKAGNKRKIDDCGISWPSEYNKTDDGGYTSEELLYGKILIDRKDKVLLDYLYREHLKCLKILKQLDPENSTYKKISEKDKNILGLIEKIKE